MGEINLQELEKLMNLFDNTSLNELKIVTEKITITMKKKENGTMDLRAGI